MHVRVLSLVLNKHSIVFVFNLILTLLSPCDSKDLFSLGSNFNRVIETGILRATYFVI